MYEEMKGKYIKHLDFILLDAFMLQVALVLSYMVRYKLFWPYKDSTYLKFSVLLMAVNITVMFFAQSYKDILRRGYLKELRATVVHMTYCIIFVVVGLFVVHLSRDISRFIMLQLWALGIINLYIGRIVLKYILRKWIVPKKVNRFITIVTTQNEMYQVIKAIKGNAYRNYRINQIVVVEKEQQEQEFMGIPIILYDQEAIEEHLKRKVVDEVFINLPPEVKLPEALLPICYQMGITVHMRLIRRPYELGGKTLEDFAGYQVLTSGMKIAKPYQVCIKRGMDIVGGIVGVLLTGLLTLIIGPMIYFKDPGPIFFSQTRIGKNGRRFKIYKFRSMYMDAEARKKELMAHNEMNGLMFKMTKDPRILPGIGEKIRNWSLDEFPQFLNVLKGEMSLIGTRPPTVDEWEHYEHHHFKRLAVKPGLTGMWQVSGRSDITDFEEIVNLDAQYITEWTLGLDFKILLKTVLVVLTKSGSR